MEHLTEQAISLLRALVAGCGDEKFSSGEECRELVEKSRSFLSWHVVVSGDSKKLNTEQREKINYVRHVGLSDGFDLAYAFGLEDGKHRVLLRLSEMISKESNG